MALKIPEQDRIYNVSPLPEGFNPDDPTQINADWIMNMLDKIVNGNYPIKSFHVYPSYDDMLLTETPEKGQTGYVLENDYKDTFFIYNGTTWAKVSGGGSSDYTELTNKPSINGVTLSGNKTSEELGIQKANLSFTNVVSIGLIESSTLIFKVCLTLDS